VEAILIVLIIFGSFASLFLVPRYLKSLERQKMAETLRSAIENGQTLPSDMLDMMSNNVRGPGLPPSPQRDLRTGIIWLGVGVGLFCFGLAVSFEEPDAFYPMLGIAAFPIFIGLAFVALGLLNRTKS